MPSGAGSPGRRKKCGGHTMDVPEDETSQRKT